QKYDEADSPNASNRSKLDHGETIHLCVREIAPCAVRRRRRGKIFIRQPVSGKSNRREEERSAPNETAHKQNAEAENDSRNYKIENGDVRGQFDRMRDVLPLVHFADQPHDRAKKGSSPAVNTPRYRRRWHSRQRRPLSR